MALQVWLPLLGDTTNQGLDNHVFSNTATSYITVSNAGKIGKCFAFNSSANNSGIYSADGGFMENYINNKSWTLCAWIMTTSSYTSVLCLSYGLRLFAGDANNHTLINLYNSSRHVFCYSSVAVNDGKWHHLAATYDVKTNAIKIYVDGVNTGNATYTSGYTYASSWTNGLYVGKDPNNSVVSDGYLFKGSMNDVRIYDHCLSNKEIKEISKALIVHYKLYGYGNNNIVPGTSPNEAQYIYPSSSYSDKWSATTSIVPSASQYTLSFYAKSTVNGDKARAHWYSPNTTTKCESNQGTVTTASDGNIDITLSTDWKKYWIVYTQSQTTAVKHLIFPRLWSGSGTGIVSVKYTKLEEGNKATTWKPNSGDALYTALKYNDTTEYDCSGFKYNGIKVNDLTVSPDSPRYNTSTLFGTGKGVYSTLCPVQKTDGDPLTVSCWFKQTNKTDYQYLIANRDNSYYNWMLYTHATDGSIQFHGKEQYKSSIIPTLNVWHHVVAVVYENKTYSLFLDGVKVVNAISYLYQTQTPSNLCIGKYGTTTTCHQPFIGYLSDVRIYNTALSDDDIKELYQASAHIDKSGNSYAYEFVEG